MKTMTKVVVSSAVLAGAAAAAHAQTIPVPDPSTDASELILIVQNTNTGNTYDLVLNANVGNASGSYLSAAQVTSPGVAANMGVSPGTIYGDAGFSLGLSTDTALQSFLTSAGSAVQWGVMGGAYIGGDTTSALKTAGNVLIATTGTAGTVTTVLSTSLLGGIPGDVSSDIQGLNLGTFDSSHGVTNAYPGSTGTPNANLQLYGNGVAQATTLGSTVSFYGLTGNGTQKNDALAYLLGTFSFNGTTLSFSGETAAVPIPAAAWLFGSGLLGLLGISRRRRDAAAG